jgi:hypothetical protein
MSKLAVKALTCGILAAVLGIHDRGPEVSPDDLSSVNPPKWEDLSPVNPCDAALLQPSCKRRVR